MLGDSGTIRFVENCELAPRVDLMIDPAKSGCAVKRVMLELSVTKKSRDAEELYTSNPE